MRILNSEKGRDVGLLVLRVGIGLMFMAHGWPKLAGGAERWAKIGASMKHLGIDFAPAFWGFAAGAAEFAGGIALVIGFMTRPFALAMAFTMLVAAIRHLAAGDGLMGASHAIEDGFVFVCLLLGGAGKYSLDRFVSRRL